MNKSLLFSLFPLFLSPLSFSFPYQDAGFDDEIVLAALLHDIGHLKGLEVTSERMGDCGVARHEKIGAEFLLSLGFSEKVATLVRRHVDAKRYLCRRQPVILLPFSLFSLYLNASTSHGEINRSLSILLLLIFFLKNVQISPL